jgi:hypothetical protein
MAEGLKETGMAGRGKSEVGRKLKGLELERERAKAGGDMGQKAKKRELAGGMTNLVEPWG